MPEACLYASVWTGVCFFHGNPRTGQWASVKQPLHLSLPTCPPPLFSLLLTTTTAAFAHESFVIDDNVRNSTSFPNGGTYFLALASCEFGSGFYVQYSLNATKVCSW